MDIAASASALKLSQAQAQASVKIVKGVNDQAKAVAAILLQGIDQTPQPTSEGKGTLVNTVA